MRTTELLMLLAWTIYGLACIALYEWRMRRKLMKRISNCNHISFSKENWTNAMMYNEARITWNICDFLDRYMPLNMNRILFDVIWIIGNVIGGLCDAVLWPVGVIRLMFAEQYLDRELTKLVCKYE